MSESPSPSRSAERTSDPTSGGAPRIPPLGLGTWKLTGADCRRTVELALALGYRHLDTAQMYGNEAEVGAALAASGCRRDQVFVTTKVDNHSHEPAAMRHSVEGSLTRLGVEAVDLLLLHWPLLGERVGDAVASLASILESGATRMIGVSNVIPDQLDEAVAAGPVSCVQAEHHVYLAQRALRARCRHHGVDFVAYSPLARGRVLDDPVVCDVASRRGVTPAAVALAWLIDEPGVAAIPKASSREHLLDNLGALDVRLGEDERRALDALDRQQRFVDPASAPWR